jgi:hypothetical protein
LKHLLVKYRTLFDHLQMATAQDRGSSDLRSAKIETADGFRRFS